MLKNITVNRHRRKTKVWNNFKSSHV